VNCAIADGDESAGLAGRAGECVDVDRRGGRVRVGRSFDDLHAVVRTDSTIREGLSPFVARTRQRKSWEGASWLIMNRASLHVNPISGLQLHVPQVGVGVRRGTRSTARGRLSPCEWTLSFDLWQSSCQEDGSK
jgi:hypothetical protein